MFIASETRLTNLAGDADKFGIRSVSEDIAEVVFRRLALTVCGYPLPRPGSLAATGKRNAHLPEDEAMDAFAVRSLIFADMLNGFDLLMIDPTKDPFEIGKGCLLDVVLSSYG